MSGIHGVKPIRSSLELCVSQIYMQPFRGKLLHRASLLSVFWHLHSSYYNYS